MTKKLIIAVFSFMGFGSFMVMKTDISKRIVVDDTFKHEFYVIPNFSDFSISNKIYYWYRAGKIQSTKAGVGGDLLHGIYRKYTKAGQLVETGGFKKGLKVGTWKEWYAEGELRKIQEWDSGLKNGNFIIYYDNSQIHIKGFFKQNLKTGIWQVFNENGLQLYSKSMKNDTLHGVYREYDLKEKIILEGRYKKGLKAGLWVDYIQNDSIFFDNGKKLDSIPKNNSLKVRIRNFFNLVFKKDSLKQSNRKEKDAIKINNEKKKMLNQK